MNILLQIHILGKCLLPFLLYFQRIIFQTLNQTLIYNILTFLRAAIENKLCTYELNGLL